MTTIAAVHGVLGAHRYPQAELTELFMRLCLPGDDRAAALARRLHSSTAVTARHLALPLERYAGLGGFTESNDAFLSVAVDLGAQAVAGALKEAELDVGEVDLIVSTTVTGIAVPSLDARIAGRLGLRPDVRRLPLMGLGCVAGAAGLARVHDHLLGAPNAVAVLVAVELCSLTVQRDDRSVANMIACGLFGDGAAAVVLTGADRASAGPKIVSSRSHLYPDTERAMGWDVGTSGLRIVLGAEVPDLVREYLAGDVAALLSEHGLTVADIDPWVCHTGGPKVIEAIEDVLGLPPDALALTWRSLREVGNLSSASVLHVLRDTLAARPSEGDRWGVLLAMGPGFCAELVLLQW
ncbi:MAG TPA: 3-oxoacyl-[acyl-carrier-protein] synthase III C-terminal domain-containing protein [Pseudonocardiaceae bacterium]